MNQHIPFGRQLPKDSVDKVVVVATKNALGEYLKYSAYICLPHRPFQDCVRLAFYTHNKIYHRVPKILGFVQAISKDEIEARTDLSDADRTRLRQLLTKIEKNRKDDWTQQLKFIFLSSPGSPDTLILPNDIINDQISSTGTGRLVAFTQAQRYVSLSRLEQGLLTTSELVQGFESH